MVDVQSLDRWIRFAGKWSGVALLMVSQIFLFAGFSQTNQNCASCALLERWKKLKPAHSVLSEVTSENLSLGWNAAAILNHPLALERSSPLEFVGQGKVPELSSGQSWWNGQGDLPNGFQRPWEFPKTNFDPSFITPYYNPQKGPMDVPWAPWNLGVLPNSEIMSLPFSGTTGVAF